MDDPQFLIDYPTTKRVRTTSIFEQLDNVYPDGKGSATAPNWRVYFHDYPVALIADPYALEIALSGANQNVATFDNTDFGGNTPPYMGSIPSATFLSDVQNGLPMFSFIEPRYNMQSHLFSGTRGDLLPNCAHPGPGNLFSVTSSSVAVDVPSDAASGELLLMRVYNLLQASPNWATTLFIVTYDEPGGTYDHVPPKFLTAPGSAFPPAIGEWDSAAAGFDWSISGGRVPAIIVSPAIEKGATIHAANNALFDHTSIIKTVWNAFNLTQGTTTSLSQRDAAAPDLTPFCTSSNSTGPFSGTIICAPSALVFLGSSTVMFYASAGAIELSVTLDEEYPWLSEFAFAWDSSTNLLTVVVGTDATNAVGVVTTSFTVSGPGLDDVTVSVTLSAS